MVDWILASSALIIAVFLIRKLFGEKLTPGVQYGLWLLVLLRLIVPVNFFQSSYSLPGLMERVVTPAGDTEEERTYSGAETDIKYRPVDAPDANTEYISPHLEETADAPSVFYMIWAIGMAAIGGIFLLVNLFFRIRIYSDRMEIEEEELEKRELFSEIPVYTTKFVATPCLAGIKSPAVYLPSQVWKNNTKEKSRALNAMICHENVHYRHGDQLWGMFRLVCLILHWYNPFVWAAALANRQDAELACDAGTVRKLGEENRYDYGRILLCMTTQAGHFGRLSDNLRHAGFCNTEMSDTKKHVERRIKRLAAAPKKSRPVMVCTLFLGFMALAYLFGGKVGRDSFLRKIVAGDEPGTGTVKITESFSPDEGVSKEIFYPSEEEVETVRKTALAGMDEEEINALTDYVKNYHNWLERGLLYDNWERSLSDPDSTVWNYIDKTGTIVTGWQLEIGEEYYLKEGEEERRKYLQEQYPEFGKVSLDKLGQMYGEPYYEENRYGAETVIQRMEELTASAENEIFRSDVEALCTALQQAKDTHEAEYVMKAHEILHDMEYFLLRYSPRDVTPYTMDTSMSGRYYSALEVWEAWREGRL